MLLIIKQSCLAHVQGTPLITQKILSDQRNMQLSNRPFTLSRPTTPTKIPASNIFAPRKDQVIRSPFKQHKNLINKEPNQYLNNHLQRKCVSPIKSGLRPLSPLIRKNTQPQPNRTQSKTFFPKNQSYFSNRMPQSCHVQQSFQCFEEQNVRNNLKLFSTIIQCQNNNYQNNSQNKIDDNQKMSFGFILRKKQLGQIKFTKSSLKNNDKISDKISDKINDGSLTTMDFSASKKLSFKDSLKARPKLPTQSLSNQPILQRSINMNDSIGTISKDDRVNESIMETSLLDLNMEPYFDM